MEQKQGKDTIKKNLVYNTIGSGFYFGCQWLTTILVVRLSGYNDAGILALAMAITNVFACVALYGVRSFQVSDLASKYSAGTYIFSRIITSGAALLLCVVVTFLNPYSLNVILCIILYMGLKASEALVDVFHGINQNMDRMDIVGKSFIIRGIAVVVSFSGVLYLTKDLLLSILAMTVFSFLCFLLYDMRRTKQIAVSIKPDFSVKPMKALLVECFPLLIFLLIASFLPMIPRYILEMYYGNEVLGIYSSVATPAVIIQVASTFIFSPLVPVFAKHYQSKDFGAFIKIFKLSFLAIIIMALISFIIGIFAKDLLLGLLFGESILPYTYLFMPVIITAILISVGWFLSTILTVFRDFKKIIVGNMVGLVVCVVLSLLLIESMGMDGVNMTLIASITVQSIVLLISVLKRISKKKLELIAKR